MNMAVRVLLIFLSATFYINAEIIVLRTAAQDSRPKYFKRDGQNYITGVCVDVLRAIEEIDPDLNFVGDQEFVPFKRIEFDLEEGRLDCFAGFIMNEERQEKYVYIDIPIYYTRNILVSRLEDDVEIKNMDDIMKLEDNLIIMSTGVAQSFELKDKGYNIDDRARNMNANIKKLLNGRGRFIYQSEVEILSALKDEKAYDLVKIQPLSSEKSGRYIAFSKEVPSDIIKRVEAALKKLQENGTLEKIYKKYI